jgi:small subunit ribosomal protein S21
MIIIKVEGGKSGLEKALKKYKKKFDRIGVGKELKKRKEYIKPSIERRNEIKKAKYIQNKYLDNL